MSTVLTHADDNSTPGTGTVEKQSVLFCELCCLRRTQRRGRTGSSVTIGGCSRAEQARFEVFHSVRPWSGVGLEDILPEETTWAWAAPSLVTQTANATKTRIGFPQLRAMIDSSYGSCSNDLKIPSGVINPNTPTRLCIGFHYQPAREPLVS